jgi:hypothetical protein
VTRVEDLIAELAPNGIAVATLGDIAERFGEQKKAAFALDFDELFLYWHAACRHGQLGRLMGCEFEHVLLTSTRT